MVDYKVDLLNKLPLFHQRIYEYQQIAGAQEPELTAILIAIESVIDNWYIPTASEEGIARLEKIMSIVPDAETDLETRRYKLFARMTEKLPYTDETLEQRLKAIAGQDNVNIIRDYVNYKLGIETTITDKGAFDEICEMLLKMTPCNLLLRIENYINEKSNLSCLTSVSIFTTMSQDI